MRHGYAHRKLGRTSSHRTALFANMAASLIKHEQIVTTLPKAKELRPFALGRVVTICSCLIRLADMLANMAMRWLDVRPSLRCAYP